MIHDNYQNLISQNNLLNLGYIGEHLDILINAVGIRDLLQTLSKMPPEMINGALLLNLQGIVISFSEMFEFCTTGALRLNARVDGKEKLEIFEREVMRMNEVLT